MNKYMIQMFIIFGVGDSIKDQFTVANSEHCYHCNNTTHWTATKVQQHISLFFMPVIPFKTKYFVACPICKTGRKIDENTFNKLRL